MSPKLPRTEEIFVIYSELEGIDSLLKNVYERMKTILQQYAYKYLKNTSREEYAQSECFAKFLYFCIKYLNKNVEWKNEMTEKRIYKFNNVGSRGPPGFGKGGDWMFLVALHEMSCLEVDK